MQRSHKEGHSELNIIRLINNHLAYVFICVLFFTSSIEVSADQNKGEDPSVHMVWAEPVSNEYAVFYSTKSAIGWLAPKRISINTNLNVTPAVTIDSTGTIWIVWSVVDGAEISLHYRQLYNNVLGEEKKINTGSNSNTAPTLLVDGNDTVWLVWAGNNGQDDEIYASHWMNGAFGVPAQITDNSVPDVLPVLSMKDGNSPPRIDWLQACETGNCAYYSTWENITWSSPLPADFDNTIAAVSSVAMLSSKNIQIPVFVKKPQSIAIYIEGEHIQSLPLRLTQQ